MHEAVVSYETILICVLWHKYIKEPPLLLLCKPLGFCQGAYNTDSVFVPYTTVQGVRAARKNVGREYTILGLRTAVTLETQEHK